MFFLRWIELLFDFFVGFFFLVKGQGSRLFVVPWFWIHFKLYSCHFFKKRKALLFLILKNKSWNGFICQDGHKGKMVRCWVYNCSSILMKFLNVTGRGKTRNAPSAYLRHQGQTDTQEGSSKRFPEEHTHTHTEWGPILPIFKGIF